MNSAAIVLCRMMRLVAVQRWPVVPKAPQSAPSRARSRLASSRTIMAFLPPISSEQGLKWPAARLADDAADFARAGEGDGAHAGMRDEGRAGLGAEAGDDVDDSGGRPASISVWTRL